MTRIVEAWGAHDFETFESLISRSAHFRAIGTDADEYWETAEEYLSVNRTQLAELEAEGWDLGDGTIRRLFAVEDGSVGWASMDYSLNTVDGVVTMRMSTVLTLESGVWRVVHWHTSVGVPNVQSFGLELTTTIDDLLVAVSHDADAQNVLARAEGTRTLVFTDVVDSTPLAEQLGDQAWVALMKDHEANIRRIISRHGGTLVKMIGDGSMLAFESARAAMRAALEIAESTDGSYAVRIGVHAGEVVRTAGDLLGATVNKAARVASVARGGQVLASSIVAELAGGLDDIVLGPPETVALKGLAGTHSVLSVERKKASIS